MVMKEWEGDPGLKIFRLFSFSRTKDHPDIYSFYVL